MSAKESFVKKFGEDLLKELKDFFAVPPPVAPPQPTAQPVAQVDPNAQPQQDPAATQGKLTNGVMVRWNGELKAGTALFVITEQGESPAPDGVHIMEDGTEVTTQGGNVTMIAPPAPQQPVAPQAPVTQPQQQPQKMEDNTPVEKTIDPAVKELLDQLQSQFKENLETVKTEFAQKFEAQEKKNKEMADTIEKFGAIPQVEPATTPTQTQGFTAKDKKEQRLSAISEFIDKQRKN